jgi:hypothetical protein
MPEFPTPSERISMHRAAEAERRAAAEPSRQSVLSRARELTEEYPTGCTVSATTSRADGEIHSSTSFGFEPDPDGAAWRVSREHRWAYGQEAVSWTFDEAMPTPILDVDVAGRFFDRSQTRSWEELDTTLSGLTRALAGKAAAAAS